MKRRDALVRIGRAALAAGAFGALPPRGSGARAARPRGEGEDVGPPSCDALGGAPIRWLVGWSPGGGYDTYSRLLEPAFERELSREVVVENAPGAAGLLAARRLSGARPDGHTLGILNGTGLLLVPLSNPRFSLDLETDFTILGRITRHDQTLFVGRRLGVGSIDELLDRVAGRSLVLGATGLGTVNMLLAALLEDLFGVRVDQVLGFPGSAEIVHAVRQGWLDGAVIAEESILGDPTVVPVLRFSPAEAGVEAPGDAPRLDGSDGLIATRPDLFADPDAARADAAAIAGLTSVGRLVAGPPGIPADLAACLRAAFGRILADPTFVASANRVGRSIGPATSEQAVRDVRSAATARARLGAAVDRVVARQRG